MTEPRKTVSGITIDIDFCLGDVRRSFIKTDAGKDTLITLLNQWRLYESCRGEDKSLDHPKGTYRIRLWWDSMEDTFHITSNTENRTLTAGIISAVVRLLEEDKIRVEEL